jgi:hypothetical protein
MFLPSLCSLIVAANVQIDLISEGVKYVVHATQIGPNQFTFTMNNSSIDVLVHTLSDKGVERAREGGPGMASQKKL